MRQKAFIGALLLLFVASAPLAEEHSVSVVDNSFNPQSLTIAPGDTVTWTNQGSNAHNVNADDGSFRCAEGCDATGGDGSPSSAPWSVSLTFDEVGEIGYHCDLHGAAGTGMFGTITVESADGGDTMPINFGMTGSWYNPDTSGQGFLIDVVPDGDPPLVQIYWFTYDQEAGGPSAQRWLIAQGSWQEGDSTVVLEVIQVTGGAFDSADPAPETQTIGMAEIQFHSCTTATMTYEFDFDGEGGNPVTGTIPIQRLSPDVMCASLAESR